MLKKYNELEYEAEVDVTVFFEQCPLCESYDVESVTESSDKCIKCGLSWSVFSSKEQ